MKIHKEVTFSSYHDCFNVIASISEKRGLITIKASNKYLSMFSAKDFSCSKAVHEPCEPVRLYYKFDANINDNSEVFIINELKMAFEQMERITNDN